MEQALALITVAMFGLLLLAISRVWLKSRSGQGISFLVLLFCAWLVSTVVWNTFFYTYVIQGYFDLSIERALFILLLLSSGFAILRHNVDLRATREIDLSILVFLLICILSMLIHGAKAQYPDFPQPYFIFIFGYVIPMFGFFFGKYFLRTEADIKTILFTLFLLGTYLSITAIFERSALRPFVYPQFIISEKFLLHTDRARGPFLNSAFDGLGITFGFLTALFFLPKRGLGKKFLISLVIILTFPAIFYTHTRSVYLIFVYALGSLLFFYRTSFSKWKVIPLIFFAGFVFLLSNSSHIFSEDRAKGGIVQMEEVSIRYKLIQRSEALFKESPIFGVGLAQFSAVGSNPEIEREQQHNHLIGLAVELGVIGISSYLLIYFLIYRRLYQLSLMSKFQTVRKLNLIVLLAIAITCNLITNVFVEPSFCMFVNLTTFLFAGIAERLYLDPSLFYVSPTLSATENT